MGACKKPLKGVVFLLAPIVAGAPCKTHKYHHFSPFLTSCLVLIVLFFQVLPPIFMDFLERRGTLARYPWISAPLQVALCGVLLTVATPACCALFPQKASIAVSSLEPEVQVSLRFLLVSTSQFLSVSASPPTFPGTL